MGIELITIFGQVYITPFIKITHCRYLNGKYELIIGWLKWELCINLK